LKERRTFAANVVVIMRVSKSFRFLAERTHFKTWVTIKLIYLRPYLPSFTRFFFRTVFVHSTKRKMRKAQLMHSSGTGHQCILLEYSQHALTILNLTLSLRYSYFQVMGSCYVLMPELYLQHLIRPGGLPERPPFLLEKISHVAVSECKLR